MLRGFKYFYSGIVLLLLCFFYSKINGQSIDRIEYFIDTDPGFGIATNVPLTPAADISDMAVAVNTTGLSNGMHTVYMRSKNTAGYWSLSNKLAFVHMPVSSPTTEIIGLEYFIDSDPGFGSGTYFAITPATDVIDFPLVANLPTLTSGLHTLYIRSKDNQGQWSLTNKHVFVKTFLNSKTIVAAEYFIDTDPGFGSATSIPVVADDTIPALNFNADVTSLNSGIHTLCVRTKDINGEWSITNKHVFVKMQANSSTITSAEYFIDTDPGFGLGTGITISANDTIQDLTFNANVSGLNSGLHTLYTRTKDADGRWSSTKNIIFIKETTTTAENISELEYYVDTDPGFGNGTRLALPASADISNHSFTANITSASTGPHTLYTRSKNPTGDWSITNQASFTKAFNIPVASFTASSTTGCAPFTVNFTDMSQNSPTSWAWDFDNNGTTDAVTQNPSYTYNTPGTYSVKLTATNISGNSTVTQTAYITVVSVYNINSSLNICQGDSAFIGGNYQSTSGIYNDTLTSINGCDSIIHTTLTITPTVTPSVSISSNFTTTCANDLITFTSSIANGGSNPMYQWQINGINVGSSAPTFMVSSLNNNDSVRCILTGNASCSSTLKDTSAYISITILQASTGSITADNCVSYTLNGITYTSSGIYTQHQTNAVGCDSVITLNLTIRNPSYHTQNYTGCYGDTIQVGSNLYYASGTYVDYFIAANGCDSIVTTNLNIIDFDTSVYLNGIQIISNQGSGSYQWHTCNDNQPIAGATGVSYIPVQNGDYYVVLSNNGCSDTSACVTINGVGIDDAFMTHNIKVYPNPNNGIFTIDFSELKETINKIVIQNMLGQTVFETIPSSNKLQIQTKNLSSGTYYLRLEGRLMPYEQLLILTE